MRKTDADNVRSLFADSGIDHTETGQIEVIIDRFDNWSNQAAGKAFGCFTGPCCLAPSLAEAC